MGEVNVSEDSLDIDSDEYLALDKQLDDLDQALDQLERRNDNLHEEAKQLLVEAKAARAEVVEQGGAEDKEREGGSGVGGSEKQEN